MTNDLCLVDEWLRRVDVRPDRGGALTVERKFYPVKYPCFEPGVFWNEDLFEPIPASGMALKSVVGCGARLLLTHLDNLELLRVGLHFRPVSILAPLLHPTRRIHPLSNTPVSDTSFFCIVLLISLAIFEASC